MPNQQQTSRLRSKLNRAINSSLLASRAREALANSAERVETAINSEIAVASPDDRAADGTAQPTNEQRLRDLLVVFAAQGVILVREFARGVLQSQNRLGVHVGWLREYTADVIVGLHDVISASRLFPDGQFNDWTSDPAAQVVIRTCEEIIEERRQAGDFWDFDPGTPPHSAWSPLVQHWEEYKAKHAIDHEPENRILKQDLRGFLASELSLGLENVTWLQIRDAGAKLCQHYGPVVVVPTDSLGTPASFREPIGSATFWAEREREFRQHATTENAALVAVWFSTGDSWRLQTRYGDKQLPPGSKRVFQSLAREAAKGLSGVHHDDAWADWLNLLRKEWYSRAASTGTSYEPEKLDNSIGWDGRPPNGRMLRFAPWHRDEKKRAAVAGENTPTVVIGLVQDDVTAEIADPCRVSADFCLELRSRAGHTQPVAQAGTSRAELKSLIDEQSAAHKEADASSLGAPLGSRTETESSDEENKNTPSRVAFPPLPPTFQEQFEGARTKAELDDTIDRKHPHPMVQAMRFPVLIQKVFFAYCTQARNAFRAGNWTLAQVGPAVDAAWLWIFDSYFSRERGAVSQAEKATTRAAFWNTVADDQRWNQHLTELEAVVNRAPGLVDANKAAEPAVIPEATREQLARPSQNRRGPKRDYDTALKVADVIGRVAPDGNWRELLDMVCDELDEAKVRRPKPWKQRGYMTWYACCAGERTLVIKAIEHHQERAKEHKQTFS